MPALHKLPQVVSQGAALKRWPFHANRPVVGLRKGPGIRLRVCAPVNVEGMRHPGTRSSCLNLQVQTDVVRRCGGETELTPYGALGAVGKGDIATAPGVPHSTYSNIPWLFYESCYLTVIIDLGPRSRGTLHQKMVESTARDHSDERFRIGPCERMA